MNMTLTSAAYFYRDDTDTGFSLNLKRRDNPAFEMLVDGVEQMAKETKREHKAGNFSKQQIMEQLEEWVDSFNQRYLPPGRPKGFHELPVLDDDVLRHILVICSNIQVATSFGWIVNDNFNGTLYSKVG